MEMVAFIYGFGGFVFSHMFCKYHFKAKYAAGRLGYLIWAVPVFTMIYPLLVVGAAAAYLGKETAKCKK